MLYVVCCIVEMTTCALYNLVAAQPPSVAKTEMTTNQLSVSHRLDGRGENGHVDTCYGVYEDFNVKRQQLTGTNSGC